MIRFILCSLFFATTCITNLASFQIELGHKEHFTLLSVDQELLIVDWSRKNLPQTGVLKENLDGFVYLKVDSGYIDKLFPLLDTNRYIKPYAFRHFGSPGAHISVFYVNERSRTGRIKEIGDRFKFKVVGFKVVPRKTKTFIVLEVTSPDLKKLRRKYGLKPYPRGHSFHITIAKKKRT